MTTCVRCDEPAEFNLQGPGGYEADLCSLACLHAWALAAWYLAGLDRDEDEDYAATTLPPSPTVLSTPEEVERALLSPKGYLGDKKCRRCGVVMPVGGFAPRSPAEGGPAAGFAARCRDCSTEASRAAWTKEKAARGS